MRVVYLQVFNRFVEVNSTSPNAECQKYQSLPRNDVEWLIKCNGFRAESITGTRKRTLSLWLVLKTINGIWQRHGFLRYFQIFWKYLHANQDFGNFTKDNYLWSPLLSYNQESTRVSFDLIYLKKKIRMWLIRNNQSEVTFPLLCVYGDNFFIYFPRLD